MAELAAHLDAELLPVADALAALPAVTAIKNIAAAVESTLAGRVADSDRWRCSGAKSPAEDYARRTGSGVGAAREALAAAAAMRDSQRLRAAAMAGLVSPEQARVIGDAAEDAPQAVDELLDLVESCRGGSGGGGGSLSDLKAAAERAEAAAEPDPDATRRRIHAQRDVWMRRDKDGSKVLSWRDNPDRIDQGHAGLAEIHNVLFQQARRQGRRERPAALDADALHLALTGQAATTRDLVAPAAPRGGGARRGGVFRDAKILIRVDAPALQRGRPAQGETCEAAGSGPIAVAAGKDLAERGATIALVGTGSGAAVVRVAHVPRARSARLDLADMHALAELLDRYGRPVAGVVHTGRQPTAAQVTALQWISPTCSAEGCTQVRTQIDHNTGWAVTGDTVLDNLVHRLAIPWRRVAA